MTKSELIKEIKKEFVLKNEATAKEYLEKFVNIINGGLLENGDKVKLDGLGTFKVKEVKAKPEHEGRNPKTGETMIIPAKDAYLSVKFSEEK